MTDTESDTKGDSSTSSDVQEATGDANTPINDEVMELIAAERVDKTMRQTLAAILGENIHGGDEDFSYYDVFEWDTNPGVDQFYTLALRNPYAFAVTFLPASTSWRDPPEIVDDAESDDDDGQTDFEAEIEEFERDLRIWNYGKRADKLAGIGQYGILVLQFDDINKPSEFENPVVNPSGLKGLRPFSEASVEDIKLGGPTSDRWGKPVKYKLDLTDEEDDESDTTESEGPDSIWAHHSRVIHIPSGGLLDDQIRGTPRQQPVYNNLIDIERTLGAAGQLVYRAAAWGININIDKDFALEDNKDELREHLHRWEVGLENVLRTHGAADVQSLGGEDIDPQPVIDPNIEAISSQPYMPPQSVLKGNETGERATTQDLKDWYGELGERRRTYITPTIVRALIDRLIKYSILTPPSKGPSAYSVEWTPLAEMSEKDEADIQHTRAQALNEWTGGMPEAMLTRQQQADYIEDGDLPSEFDEVADDVQELEEEAAAAATARSVEEMTSGDGYAVADGGEGVDD
ncbi:anti-CBASS protein Acb1 family protein [Halorubrum trueperi]|uniref:Anti-CBASS protein Acb1 family protein n=1 Tax=Halorubrum trueperi TaxID=2004704 RepID=A0ABD5UHG8_9EURY